MAGSSSTVAPLRGLHRSESDASDRELVFRARGGDSWAQRVLYHRHAPTVLGLATRLLADEAEARDVMQDSFIAAFDRLEQLEQPEAFVGWLKSITVRNVHRRFRRRRWTGWLTLTSPQLQSGLSEMQTADVPPEVAAELTLIDRVLKALPAEQRVAWTLRHVEGEALASVASLMNCSLATAKRRISSAQARLDAHTRGLRA